MIANVASKLKNQPSVTIQARIEESNRWTSRWASRRSPGHAEAQNWGRWGKDDQIGTLNHVTPQDIVKAASRSAPQCVALGIPLDRRRPACSAGDSIRSTSWPPAPTRCGRQDWNNIIRRRHADAVRTGRHPLGSLGHVFYEDKAYNGRRQADRRQY
jgi:hypothetical protein